MPEGLNMDFLRASSYTRAATTSQDAVVMGLVSKIPIEGRHILLVEDIIDTGKTLQVSYMHDVLQHGDINEAASVSLQLFCPYSWSWNA
jgi:hypoxanthine-guanine phosphoribosyltransferase